MNKVLTLACVIVLLSVLSAPIARAQDGPERQLLPLGGGYSDTYPVVAETIVAHRSSNTIRILILAPSYSTNPDSITDAERQVNLEDAKIRRAELEGACQRAAPEGVTCTAELLPVFVRGDALDPMILEAFDQPVDAFYFLGGDQTVAMQVLANTPLEDAIAAAYENGALIAGTSAGSGVQAANMLGGYNDNFARNNALNFGSSDVWNTPDRRGLYFTVQKALLDQHFYQRSRLGRLLNAIALPGVPHVGIGVDAFTGVHIYNEERLEDVFGLYTVTILDAETYHAAEAVTYNGPRHTLGLRNVLLHLLAPGDFSYDLGTRQVSLGAPLPVVERSFDALALPEGAGSLILGGNLLDNVEGSPVLARFVELCGADSDAKILVIAAGYPTDASGERNAGKFAEALGAPADVLVLPEDATEPLALPLDAGYTGLLLTARDPSQLDPALLAQVRDAWLSGLPLLADDAAAALAGSVFSAHAPNANADDQELVTQKSFWLGRTDIRPGLGLLSIAVEPQILSDNRWGRFYALAYDDPSRLTLGLTDDTALLLTPDSEPTLLGDNVLFTLDLHAAQLALGTNDGYVIGNGLLDVFAAGETVVPAMADVNAAPVPQPTPDLSTPEPTPEAPEPTASPEPTAAPTAAPPAPTAASTPSPVAPETSGANRLPYVLGGATLLAALALVGFVLWRKKPGA